MWPITRAGGPGGASPARPPSPGSRCARPAPPALRPRRRPPVSPPSAAPPSMAALVAASPDSHSGVSDVPLWDSIAAAREYQVTGNPLALRKAESDFGSVAGNAQLYGSGACPGIFYQHVNGGSTQLKT